MNKLVLGLITAFALHIVTPALAADKEGDAKQESKKEGKKKAKKGKKGGSKDDSDKKDK
ncbi:MAG: hypothetical protein U0745_19370 [Polyangia bacterium]|jgi:hypothetical protein